MRTVLDQRVPPVLKDGLPSPSPAPFFIFLQALYLTRITGTTIKSMSKATPPPISPIKSLLSETWASWSYRLQEYSDGLLLPTLFTASTHTLSPGSRDPTIPLRETWLKSRAGLSLLSTTTLYLDTTDDGAHQWTSMLPMCSPSVMVKNSFRRGACGS